MASGKVHGRVTVALTPLAGIMVYGFVNDIATSLLATFGCLVGLILEPDLDIDHVTASEKRLMKLIPFGILWYIVWMPYALMIPHRHPISHLPVLGTLIRYLYLAIAIGLPISIIGILVGQPTIFIDFVIQYTWYLKWMIVGTAISDFGHWVLDI